MKTNTAVLHIRNKEPQAVASLADRVDTGMSAHKDVFPAPDPTAEVFSKEVELLYTSITEKDGSKIKNHALVEQTEVVYGMLKRRLYYTNMVAKGDKAIILLSGFDCNDEPVAHDVPEKAVIKRIEDGSKANSAKVFVETLDGADRYKLESTTSLTEPIVWKTVIDYGTTTTLEDNGLTRRQEIYYRVTGGNRRGWGLPSEPMMFFPR